MALDLANVGPGDYVISTPMTCLATNLPILARGAKILWADVDPTTGCMSAYDVEGLLQGYGKEVKAVICVHWGGYPCDLLVVPRD